jgi:hypothetical protein
MMTPREIVITAGCVIIASMLAVMIAQRSSINELKAMTAAQSKEMTIKDGQIAEGRNNIDLLQKQAANSEIIREKGKVITKTIYKVKEVRGLSVEEIGIARSIIDRLRKDTGSGTSDSEGVPETK